MRKVLIPKKDYVKELIKIIRVTKDEQKLRNLLSDYHEKDIAEAITFLTETERKHLYRVLGSERIAEIISYFDDAERAFLVSTGTERSISFSGHVAYFQCMYYSFGIFQIHYFVIFGVQQP